LANCIIFYNASILSGIYERFKKSKRNEECEKIIRFSPVAWQHINLIGTYEFDNENKIVNLQEVIENLMSNPEIDLCSTA
jgi:hypothetical protein